MYNWDFSVLFTGDFATAVVRGAEYTLLVSVFALFFGAIIGLTVAVIRVSHIPVVSQIAYVYVDFFRTTPALVQLIWFFYVLPILIHVSLTAIITGIMALSLNSGAFLAEIFRGGIVSIGRGQRDASQVLGLSSYQTLRYVILPQALRRVLPAAGNVFISLIKDSALLSVIAVSELTYMMQTEVASTFRPLEIYTALAVMYFCLTYPLSLGISALERRFRVV
jgi:polar amino acid transport system permease protein